MIKKTNMIEYIRATRNIPNENISDNVLFSYVGDFNYRIVDGKIEEVKAFLNEAIQSTPVRKRIYSLVVESLDNIYRHGEPVGGLDEEKNIIGYFLIKQNQEDLHFEFGNFMRTELAANHDERWLRILKADAVSLSEIIKNQLEARSNSGFEGAGIGLMDIKRKLEKDAKMKIIFDKFDESLMLYVLQVNYFVKIRSYGGITN